MPNQKLVTVLKNVMLAGGATTIIPHGLKVGGRGVTPTQITCDRASSIGVTGYDSLGVSFTNLSVGLAVANFRVEYDHSIHSVGAEPHAWQGHIEPAIVGVEAVYGCFSDMADQPLSGGVALVQFDTVEAANGVSVAVNPATGKPSRLTVATPGVYAVNLSPQLVHVGGGTETISFWLRKNGADVARSASSLEMGNNNNRTLPFIEILLPLTAGQWIEWAFTSVTGTDISLKTYPITGAVPAIPSAIANVKRLGAIP